MTMTPNELRALADALEPMAKAPRFEDFDVPAFCAWVRACADEKPVGVYVHRPAELRYGVEWLVGDPMPDGTQLFTHPAPAAPQADAQPVANLYYATSQRGGRRLAIADPMSPQMGQFAVYTHPAPAVPAGWKLVPVEPTEEWLEVGRKAIEDALVEWRDERLSELNRANGCVIRERDGTPSNVIRFGPETALRIGYKAMLAAAPASPQAEPIDPHMIVAEDRFPDEQAEPPSEEVIEGVEDYLTDFREQIHAVTDLTQWATAIAGYVLLVHGRQSTEPQAEPKREPNPDEVICPACTHQFRAIPENVQAQLSAKRDPLSDEQIDTALQTYPATLLALMGGEMTVGEFKSALRRLARTVEHAHGISGGGHD